MKKATILITGIYLLVMFPGPLYAAVGCTLNDPDRDVRRIFPGSTGYKTEFITIEEAGGEKLFEEVQEKLGDKFDPVYETIDVPYAYYTVLKGREKIGYIHGVNQRGTYGGMQLILATDLDGKIIDFYYQKISSPESRKFRDKSFMDRFTGMTLKDFYDGLPAGDAADPTENSHEDFRNTIRGLKKNLILFNEFKLKNKYRRNGEKQRET